MTYVLLAFGCGGLTLLALMVLAVTRAPLGYEDRDGFHEGDKPETSPADQDFDR